jgi:hypothetical protein
MITALILVMGLVAREALGSTDGAAAARRRQLLDRIILPVGVAFLCLVVVIGARLAGSGA